jgi:hypothetical protein
MDFAELKAELIARGFSDLSTTRQGVYINAANQELDRMALWPWREESVSGPSPLAIADLGPIEAVINMTQSDYPLEGRQFRDLLDWYGDLAVVGSPWCYYVAWPTGTPAIATFPTSSDTIGVQYWKVPPVLTGTASPASPVDAHYLIVDLAVRRASRDVGDHEGAEAIQGEIDRQLEALLFQYQPGVADDPGHYIVPGA